MSIDGKISSSQRDDARVTSDDDRSFLYNHRITCDGIMLGGTTILLDDPSLTTKTREQEAERQKLGKQKSPSKIGIISDISGLKLDSAFINKGDAEKIIFTTERSSKDSIKNLSRFASVYVYGKEKVDLTRALIKLYELGLQSILVEGGGELIFSLLKDDLVDEINLKIGDLILGGRTAPTLCDGEGFTGESAKQFELIENKSNDSNIFLKYRKLEKSEV